MAALHRGYCIYKVQKDIPKLLDFSSTKNNLNDMFDVVFLKQINNDYILYLILSASVE